MDVFSGTQLFMEEADQLNDIGFPEDYEHPKRVLRRRMLTHKTHGEVSEYFDGELRSSPRMVADGLADTIVVAHGGLLDYFGPEDTHARTFDLLDRTIERAMAEELEYGFPSEYLSFKRMRVRGSIAGVAQAYDLAEKENDPERIKGFLSILRRHALYGMAAYFGADGTREILKLVYESNLAKKWPDGTYHKDSFGKVIKPKDWVDPGASIQAVLDQLALQES